MSKRTDQERLSARQSVVSQLSKYNTANRAFGRTLELYNSDCPIGYAIAHAVSVNPTLQISPLPDKNRRRGFMYATPTMAKYAGVKWEKLDDPNVCAYVWGYDINTSARSLYLQNPTKFTSPDSDFWNTAYLKHYVGPTVFDYLWLTRDTNSSSVYSSLLLAAEHVNKKIGGYSVPKLQHAILYKSQFVTEMAKKAGKCTSTDWGRTPVLTKDNLLHVYGAL